jgi:hypothetical protein
MVRQGDVLLVPVTAVPGDLKPEQGQPRGRAVLAEGEQTGHRHAVIAPGARVLVDPDGNRYLRLRAAAVLSHQEHDPIMLQPGLYRITRQREYQPEAPRWVAD